MENVDTDVNFIIKGCKSGQGPPNPIILIAELAEHIPIIIQNGSNPSSQKNLDVRPYDRTRYYF